MAQGRYDGIDVGELRLVKGAMPEIGRGGLREIVRMADEGLGQPVETRGPALRRQRPPIGQGGALRLQTGLQPVSHRIGKGIVQRIKGST
jgi:hypothetical protein